MSNGTSNRADDAPTDEQLLEAVHHLFTVIDPPPADLADGVLARIGVEDLELEYELLSLVDDSGVTAVRGSTGATRPDTDGSVTLEFAGGSYRVLLRIDSIAPAEAPAGPERRRVDGWVVPAVPMRVSLVADDGDRAVGVPDLTSIPDENGRFEFTDVEGGRFRVWLHPEPATDAGLHPFATLPFLI